MEYELKDKIKISISAIHKGESVFPNTEEKNPLMHNHFIINVCNKETTKQTHFNYYVSHNDYLKGIITMNREDLLFALRSIIEASNYGNESFNDFCANLGYNNDSMRAHKIYIECKRVNLKLNRIGITEDIRYDILNDLEARDII